MASHDPLDTSTVLQGLLPGERLLWTGRPRPGLTPNSRLLLSFAGVVLLVVSLFLFQQGQIMGPIDASDPQGRVLRAMRLIQGISVLVPVLVLAVPAGLDLLARRRTAYALTDRRVVIAAGLNGRRVTSRSLLLLGAVTLEVRADGSGTIGFGPETKQAAQAFGFTWLSPGSADRFDGIPDAREVYALLMTAQRAALGAPAAWSGSQAA
jgi:hypothetical protein